MAQTKCLPDKTSKAMLTKCLPDITSADRKIHFEFPIQNISPPGPQVRNVLYPAACRRESGLVKRRSCPSLELLSWMRVPRPTQVSEWWIQVKSIVTNLHKLFVKHLKTRDWLMKWTLIYMFSKQIHGYKLQIQQTEKFCSQIIALIRQYLNMTILNF